MLSKSLARIKSAPKQSATALIAGAAIVAATIICTVFFMTGGSDTPAASYRLSLPRNTYALTPAVTNDEQERGLGGRDSLGTKEGMLFWYADTAKRCFWMKDMRFAIDMLWVSYDKKLVKIEGSVQPDTYPQAYCATAQYVIELRAGTAAKEGLRVGDKLSF